MNKPFYTSAAERDLADILTYVARDNPNAALSLLEKIEAKCLLIGSAPEIGETKPQLGVGVRANVVGRYVIFHRHAKMPNPFFLIRDSLQVGDQCRRKWLDTVIL